MAKPRTTERAALEELAERWQEVQAIVGSWNAWEEFIPFLDFNAESRPAVCSTGEIELLIARYPRAVKGRGISRRRWQH